MNFEQYLDNAWTIHPTEPLRVYENFSAGLSLVESNEQLLQLSLLITHVCGEHLGLWQEGMSCLAKIKKHRFFESESETGKAVNRSDAVLSLGENVNYNLNNFSISDQARIYAVAANSLAHRKLTQAEDFFYRAITLVQSIENLNDPATRAVAISGNNLACILEESSSLTSAQTEFMIFSAQQARKYWALAGSWLEVSRAEYRLAKSYIKACKIDEAVLHADICLKMCQQNNADEVELSYALKLNDEVKGMAPRTGP